MMKTKLLTFVNSSVLCVLFTLNIVLAQNQVDPIGEIINLESECQKTIELSYRSPKLTAPNGKTSVYFEGILRKPFEPSDSLCNKPPSQNGETPITTMIVKYQGRTKKMNFRQQKKCYATYQPISFSPNNQYLLLKNSYGCPHTEGRTNFIVIDIQNNYKELPLSPCEDYPFGADYNGYISSSEILFSCIYGNTEYQVVNPKNRSIRKISESLGKSAKVTKLYGTISGEMVITKKQVFPKKP